MTRAALDLAPLEHWPPGAPAGLVILGPPRSDALAASVRALIASSPGVSDWWLARAENTVAGPGRDPAFGWAGLVELANAQAARDLAQRIASLPASDGTTMHAARPVSRRAMRVLDVVQRLLRVLPEPRTRAPAAPDPRWLGGANPTLAQIAHMNRLPQEPAIGVLNMHRYARAVVDPIGGKAMSGRDLAKKYLARGFFTFMRLGGRPLWMAGNKGRLFGPPTPAWDQFAMIWYPSRAAFRRLSEDPELVRTMPYRKTGMEAASVTHTAIVASSRARDVR